MFASIRRHQKWLFIVVVVLVIFSFVIYLDPATSGGRGRSGASQTDFGTINGRALSREEVLEAYQDARLEVRMLSGRWPGDDEASRQMFNLDSRIQHRLVLLEKIRESGIQVGDEAVVEWIANVFRDPRSGGFQLEAYQNFLSQDLSPQRISEADFQRFARGQAGIEHLFRLAGLGGGLIAPGDAEAAFRRENEQMNAQIVLFNATNFLSTAAVADTALTQFYSNNLAAYRIPERVQVTYVRFDATNFLAAADTALAGITNLQTQLMALYQRRGADTFRDAQGNVLAPDAALVKLKEEQRTGFALIEAQKQATAFAQQLFDLYEKQPGQTNNLERLAAATGVESQTTEPFPARTGPAGLRVPESFSRAAFSLSEEQPMAAEPIASDEAVYVISLKKRWPSEVPPLASIRDQVLEDFRRREAMDAARRAGEAFHQALTNGLAQQKTFEVIAAESRVTPLLVPPFSLGTRSLPGWEARVNLSALKDAAAALAPGQASGFVPTPEGGFVLRLISRQPVDDSVLKAELPAFTSQLRTERRNQVLNEWLGRQQDAAGVTGLPTFGRSRTSQAN